MQIALADPGSPDITALLTEHLADMHATSPACSVHALDVDRLRAPHVRFVAARDGDGALLGVGAIAVIEPVHGEIKSMRTAGDQRGRGVATAVLDHLMGVGRDLRLVRVSLETGTSEPFHAAHRLYERAGFTECGPFAGYALDPFSRFYTREL
ncbi:GNAT family N-acetyltransferase [Demequina subtropica]|uniref:GNAT family N-acetyltransferase n=1 Tax=Demequina subtropica TaxID=1638989 RepID=UPI000781C618|nr:GNAT family N-acetyltransferase [Demequina subtropica]